MDQTTRRQGADRTGSLFQRPNGLWVRSARIVDDTGKVVTIQASSMKQAECQAKFNEKIRALEAGTIDDKQKAKATLGDFLTGWLARHETAPSTHLRYEQLIKIHVIPAIGKVKLASLRAEHLERLYTQLRTTNNTHTRSKGPTSTRTIQQIHAIIRVALKDAMRLDYIGKNVASLAQRPRVQQRPDTHPSAAQVIKLLETSAAANDPNLALWVVAAFTAKRKGELLGLKWSDIDFDQRTIRIERNLLEHGVKGGIPAFGPTKTKASHRVLPMPQDAAAALRVHRQQQLAQRLHAGPAYANWDLVFCTHTGAPHLARNITKYYKRALSRAGLPDDIRFHDLRHAAATLWLGAGIPLATISDLLGHSSISITKDIYAHRAATIEEEAGNRLGALLKGTWSASELVSELVSDPQQNTAQ
jgi:integrase